MKRIMVSVIALAMLLTMLSGCVGGKDESYTLLWVSDPQWYSFEYPEILTVQNDWVVENAKEQDIRYILHTGDFVNLPHEASEWDVVDKEYQKWDEAGLKYGVLAGNHDVDGDDHSDFSARFGRERYEGNEWYGDDYQDNFGHYDLLTIADTPFIFVYMGYNKSYEDEDYAWLNEALAAHRDRVAVLLFHEFLDVGGNRTPNGEQFFNRVVLKNPNVRMVLCGHNYNAARRYDTVDDNGDGKADRTVYQMMANYQDTTNGGNGFMRFMECRPSEGVIVSRTYSPYTDAYGSDYEDGTIVDEFGMVDEFTIPFDFSAPTITEEVEGVCVTEPSVTLAKSDTHEAIVKIPVAYQNEVMTDGGVGVYDRTFSLDTAAVCESVESMTFVQVLYDRETKAYTLGQTVKGQPLSIPQNGFVMAISADATDTCGKVIAADGVFTAGREVTMASLDTLAAPAKAKAVSVEVPRVTGTYFVHASNAPMTDKGMMLYDAAWGDTLDGKAFEHAMMIVCEPKGEAFAVTKTVSASAAIPKDGFVLAVDTAAMSERLKASYASVFADGTEILLHGRTIGEEPTGESVSLIPASAGDWKFNANTMQVTDTDEGTAFANTNGQWAIADYTFATPIEVDADDTTLVYTASMAIDAAAKIVLYCRDSSTTSYADEETVALHSYIDGWSVPQGGTDAVGDGQSHQGTKALADMGLSEECFDEDGTLCIKAIRVYASGEANAAVSIGELMLKTGGNSVVIK